MQKEDLKLKGHWTIIAKDTKTGKVIKRIEQDNQLTNAYKNSVLNQLMGIGAINLSIKYIGLGTDGTAATPNDTQLGAEFYRRPPSSKRLYSNYVESIFTLLADEFVGTTIREIGVFCDGASGVLNSGVMLSRVVVDIEKTANMELMLIRRDYVNI